MELERDIDRASFFIHNKCLCLESIAGFIAGLAKDKIRSIRVTVRGMPFPVSCCRCADGKEPGGIFPDDLHYTFFCPVSNVIAMGKGIIIGSAAVGQDSGICQWLAVGCMN